jgi:hypothetical protein
MAGTVYEKGRASMKTNTPCFLNDVLALLGSQAAIAVEGVNPNPGGFNLSLATLFPDRFGSDGGHAYWCRNGVATRDDWEHTLGQECEGHVEQPEPWDLDKRSLCASGDGY